MAGTSARMLALLSLLQSRRDWPGTLLAQRLDVSPRTVRRDVDLLRELGYSVRAIKGPDGGYRLDAGSELPPLLFDDDQVTSIALALQIAPVDTAGLGEAADRALATVRQVMPGRLQARLDAIRVRAAADPAAVPVRSETLVSLTSAIRDREIARFDYETEGTTGSADAARRVEPHHLVIRRGRWYLLGWDVTQADWRTYRVDRIRLRSHTGGRFTPRELPFADAETYLDATFRGAGPSGEWPCVGEATLAVDAHVIAPYVPGGSVISLGPDRCRVSVGAWSWVALAAQLAGYDADILEVEPPALREACAAVATRLGSTTSPATAS